jgi:hypothetical protein
MAFFMLRKERSSHEAPQFLLLAVFETAPLAAHAIMDAVQGPAPSRPQSSEAIPCPWFLSICLAAEYSRRRLAECAAMHGHSAGCPPVDSKPARRIAVRSLSLDWAPFRLSSGHPALADEGFGCGSSCRIARRSGVGIPGRFALGESRMRPLEREGRRRSAAPGFPRQLADAAFGRVRGATSGSRRNHRR